MQKLLSLPPNLVEYFHEIEKVDKKEWFCTSDPVGARLGSGGGTAWLLESCRQAEAPQMSMTDFLACGKRILLHAGGQSRRLPGYAPSGKILTPIPVFRWARGQRLTQSLLSLQLPLYERIMEKAPASLHTLIASGDVYIRTESPLQNIPDADVVCYGLWVDASLAQNHGVFAIDRQNPERLDFMLQKPSVEALSNLTKTHFYLMDIGIWILSDRAVELLIKQSKKQGNGQLGNYDLYSDFGYALGEHPKAKDLELNGLSVAILPLEHGEFYHYGTSRELISSTVALQNIVKDQRVIMHNKIKPHPAIFIQNSTVKIELASENSELWIENSCVGSRWKLKNCHIITGVPQNDWSLELPSNVCVDVVPIGETGFVARPYGFCDKFKGGLQEESTLFMGIPFVKWMQERGIEMSENVDIQSAKLFPLCKTVADLGEVLCWMVSDPMNERGRKIWSDAERYSANDLSDKANLLRLTEQRASFFKQNLSELAENHNKSVFYQVDLSETARCYAKNDIALPKELSEQDALLKRIHDSMFRSAVLEKKDIQKSQEWENNAFSLLKEGLLGSALSQKQSPRLNVYKDQIVWGRSPVRIDLAGGWTDTPPYCLYEGGNVVNMAIELNGQPPLQVYVKPSSVYKIVLRSIDLGAREELTSWDDLRAFNKVGSPFSIPKAALALAGFLPEFCEEKYRTLEEQLKAFGSGIEITLLAAIPAGSGLGTSSVLGGTVLGAIADFCSLRWDKNEICQRTLILEQLLTTGGGWQDQYGGILHGIKLLQTQSGFDQNPIIHWLPDYIFTNQEYASCHLLYYTGVTRTAKGILKEIVKNMFLNSTEHLRLLSEMKLHAMNLYDTIQRGDFEQYGRMVGMTWQQNKRLDAGTNPSQIENIISMVQDLTLGLKLPGAGGGGYLYMVAKDDGAALKIRKILSENRLNNNARFVEMSLSKTGLQISKS